MKILQNKIVILTMLILFIGALIWLYFCGNAFGIPQNEIPLTITNAILMLLATFIAISLPLFANSEAERQNKNDELKANYISIARYVGEELADNIVRIEDLMSNNKITFEELDKKFAKATEEDKAHQSVGIWKAVADDLLIGLEDINHRSLIMSGILTRVPDNEMNSEIKNAYSKMANLKQTLRRLSIFFGIILAPPPNFPPQVVSDVLKTKVPVSIKTSQEDIDIFLECAKEAIKRINKMIKPYGKEVKIVEYQPKAKSNNEHI